VVVIVGEGLGVGSCVGEGVGVGVIVNGCVGKAIGVFSGCGNLEPVAPSP
jgi:hypothetical protein